MINNMKNGKISKTESITLLVKFPAGTLNTTSELGYNFKCYYDIEN